MADEPDNHTLRLLREMREEMNRRFDTLSNENMSLHAQTRAELASVLGTVVETAKAVNVIHAGLDETIRGQKIIENELRGLRGRVERIEDRLDPVKV
jgi:hypothetical protein